MACHPRCARAITKVTFTTETPEYWEALAETEPQILLARYRELVSPQVQMADLFAGGRSVCNHARGIVHYVMKINGIAPLVTAEQDTPIRGRVADTYDALTGGRPATTGGWSEAGRAPRCGSRTRFRPRKGSW